VDKGLAKPCCIAGGLLLALSALLYAVLEVATSWEQAKTPGEKNLGVGVLAMLFFIPALVCAAIGVMCLIVGVSLLVRRRYSGSRR
jgi:UPF0716 family protein affecting phage T7 exclusion